MNQNKITQYPETPRIKQVSQIDNPTSFDEWQKTIQSNFPDCSWAAEIALSVITQILITDIANPFALVLVDVPSSGKTITINFFSSIDEITYCTDKFTPASFVSNAVNVDKKKLPEIDLLPRIRYKTLLIRDLAPMFGQRDDDLLNSLGILTRVLDGEGLQTDTGMHGQRHYKGDFLFMMLAGSTPINPRIWRQMGTLGSRLFFINMNSRDKSEDELVAQLTDTPYKVKELVCRDTTERLIKTLWHRHNSGIVWDKKTDDQNIMKIIARCAMLLACLRGTIYLQERTSQNGYENEKSIEKPTRIVQLLYNLARGHAVAQERLQLQYDDLLPVIKVAIDSAPVARSRLFRNLIKQGGKLSTSQAEQVLGRTKPIAKHEMEILSTLNICDIETNRGKTAGRPEKIITLKKDFHWFLSEEFMNLMSACESPRPQINKPNSTL